MTIEQQVNRDFARFNLSRHEMWLAVCDAICADGDERNKRHSKKRFAEQETPEE